jgi:hypothetical protein
MRRAVRVCSIPTASALSLLVISSLGQAQETPEDRAGNAGGTSPSPNAVFLEVFGNGGAFSLNYQRLVSEAVAIRAGVANWSTQDFEKTTVTTIPLTVSYLFDASGGGVEVGGGLTLGSKKEEERPLFGGDWLTTSTQTVVDLTGILGYRWVRPGGWMFRVAFTPFIAFSGDYPDSGFSPSAGLSVGRVF